MKKILFILFFIPSVIFAQTLELPFGVRVLNPEPLDAYYFNTSGFVYASTAEVITQVVSAVRYQGQTFNVSGIEYWFADGITDGDLVEKNSASGNFWPLDSDASLITDVTIDGGIDKDLQFTNFKQFSVLVDHPTDAEFNLSATDGTEVGSIQLTPNNASMVSGDGTNQSQINMGASILNLSLEGNAQATLIDNKVTPTGLKYAGSNYVTDPLSLTTKEYVDGISSLTSTYVGYGSGSNALTGESDFTYDASANIMGVPSITMRNFSATTSSVVRPLIIDTQSTGTPNLGFGTGISFSSELSGGQPFVMGSLDFSMTNVTFGSEDSDFVIRTAVDGVLANKLRVRSSGVVAILTAPTVDNANTDILTIDGSGNIEVRQASSISSSPAGSNTQVQFNNSGAFGADADFIWNSTISNVIVSGSSGFGNTAGTLALGSTGVRINGPSAGAATFSLGGIETNNSANLLIRNSTTGGTVYLDPASSSGGDIFFNLSPPTGSYFIINGIPSSSAGLPSGAVYSNAGILTIVP